MTSTIAGGGQFNQVVLHPVVTLSAGDPAAAQAPHRAAHAACFIAGSVNFPVRCEPRVVVVQSFSFSTFPQDLRHE